MKNLKILFIAGCFFSQTVLSQELVPATSEDQEIFNQQLEQAEKQNAELKAKRDKAAGASSAETRKANFGQIVTAEAKKLKDSATGAKKGIGSAVSVLKRKNQTQTQVENSSSSNSSGSSASKDGRNSAPRLNNSGGAPSQPGQSGNRNK